MLLLMCQTASQAATSRSMASVVDPTWLAATSLEIRRALAKALSVTWGGNDPVSCRADSVSCSAISAAAGEVVYSAITHYTIKRDMAPLSRLLADGHSPDVAMVKHGSIWTPLMMASVLGEMELIVVLLEHGANVSLTDATAASALTYACGDFFKAETAPSRKVEGQPPEAVKAALVGMATNVVQILVDFGAELGEVPSIGIEASWSAYRALVAKAKDTDEGQIPTRHRQYHHFQRPGSFEAASHGHTAVLRRLLERGMSPDARDDKGTTLLMIASFDSQVKIVQVRANPNPNLNPNPNPHPNPSPSPSPSLSPSSSPSPRALALALILTLTSSCSAAVPTRRSLTTMAVPP